MGRKGIITVKADSRFRVDYETYRLVRALDFNFTCKQGREAGVYL